MPPDPVAYVVDDDLDVCRSLTLLLRGEGFTTRPYLSAGQLLAESGELAPGIVLSDICMPDLDGIDFLERWRTAGRRDPVVLMTGHADVPTAVRALRGGAFNFIEKPFTHADLLAVLREAFEASRARTGNGSETGTSVLDALSRREREVFAALVAGATNKSIALELGISPRTVEIHRAHLMHKIGVHSLPQLIRVGIEAGLDEG